MNGTNEDNQNDDEDLWIPENAPDPRKWTVSREIFCNFVKIHQNYLFRLTRFANLSLI